MKQFIIILSALLAWQHIIAQKQKLSLSAALAIASTKNKTLAISNIENKKTEELTSEYRSYKKPEINAMANYTLYAEKPVIFMREQDRVKDLKVGGTNTFTAGISASYNIIQPALNEKIGLARINTQVQRKRTEDLEVNLLLDVAKTYLTILFYRQQAGLLKQTLERNEKALSDSRLLLLQGKGLKTDTLKNFIDAQNTKASIYNLESNISIKTLELLQLLGSPANTDAELSDSLEDHSTPYFLAEQDSLKSRALNLRPDIKTKELMIDHAYAEKKLAAAAFKPQLTAFAHYMVQGQSDKLSLWNYALPRTSFAGLQLSLPLYSGRRSKYKNAFASYTIQQNKIALENIKQEVETELETLSAKLKEAHRQKLIQEKNLDAAAIHYNMITERYHYGMSSRLELADAELSLTQAKINHLYAIYIIRLTEFELKKASGTLLIK